MKNIVRMLMLSATVLLAACSDPNEGELFVTPTENRAEMSIVDAMETDVYNGQFSEWIKLLRATNYYNALKSASATATVFSPTNEAMSKFLNSRGLASVEELVAQDSAYAKAVVREHIISGSKYYDNQIDVYAKEKAYIPERNLFGEYLYLSYGYLETDMDDALRPTEYQMTDSIYINSQARIGRFEADSCLNGVLYVMADVIKPLAETISQKLKADRDYTIFAQALEESGYDSIANKFQDTTWVQGGKYVVNTYRYTCFAVPDEVYTANGITSVSDLTNYIMANCADGETDTRKALNNYIQYHFLTRDYTTAEIFNFLGDEEVLVYPVKLEGQSIIANRTTAGKVINNNVPILRSDIKACNGYIHKVGGIMPIYHPDPINMKWDFLNSADLISIVNDYGAWKGLGNLFSAPVTTTNEKYDFTGNVTYSGVTFAEPTSFTYNANETKASRSTYHVVGFYKDFLTSNKPSYNAYMNNYLCLNLGFGGWVEFTTPSIISGKYKIVLHYLTDVANQKTLYASGSSTRFQMDDDIVTRLLYKGITYTRADKFLSAEITLWDSKEFTETSSHTFRITMRDVQAKTSGTYHQYLDYIEFIPLD